MSMNYIACSSTGNNMDTRFESIGLYLPEKTVTTKEVVDQLSMSPPFDLSEITGIQRRHVCAEHENTLSMALEAARDCLDTSRYTAEELDCVISCSISRSLDNRYYFEPAMSLWIKNRLGAPQALNFDLSNACAGMLTGVYVLDGLIKSGVVRNGMVVSAEKNYPATKTAIKEIDSIFHDQFASLTVGDAATAVILDDSPQGNEKLDLVEMTTCAEPAHLCLGMPSTENTGIALYTKNIKLHDSGNLRIWPHIAERIFAQADTTLEKEDFDYIIPHQIGLRFTQKSIAIAKNILGGSFPKPLHCLEDCANTSSTSHFVVLYQALQQGLVGKGSKLLMVPAASGIVTGCISVTLGDLKVSL